MHITFGDIPGAVAGIILVVSVLYAQRAGKVLDPWDRRKVMFRSMLLLCIGQMGLLAITLFTSLEGLSIWNLAMIAVAIRGMLTNRKVALVVKDAARD
jgi:hypothetical protein